MAKEEYTVVDTSGKEIEPDFTKGRIVATDLESLTMTYATYDEQPDLDDDGNIIVHGPKPTVEEQIANLQSAITDLYEATLS